MSRWPFHLFTGGYWVELGKPLTPDVPSERQALLQAADPVPERPKIYLVERQPSNILVKINGML